MTPMVSSCLFGTPGTVMSDFASETSEDRWDSVVFGEGSTSLSDTDILATWHSELAGVSEWNSPILWRSKLIVLGF